MQVAEKAVVLIVLGVLLAGPARLLGGKSGHGPSTWESTVPLGSDSFVLNGQRRGALLVAAAMAPESHGGPREASFRVTVSARDEVPADLEPLKVESGLAVGEYVSGLRFQVRVFHGLEMEVVKPAEVRVMAAEEQGAGRVYRVRFHLPRPVPEDRMRLEVLSAEGERLARFPFGE